MPIQAGRDCNGNANHSGNSKRRGANVTGMGAFNSVLMRLFCEENVSFR
jgi:predicted amino acid dehydrogenase